MIYNERQFKITSKQIEALKNNLVEIAEEEAVPDWLKEAQISALKSQISDLMAQVTEYELLKEGKIKYTECSDLNVLPKTLIRARISKGLSQKEFAEILGMPQQQIQRYEASNYMGASLSKLINIASVLEVKFTESWSGANYKGADSLFVWDEENAVDWNKFPIKEMLKKGWIDIKNKISPALAVKEFFSNTAGPQFATALHRKKFHGKNTPNEYSLLAWQARIIQKARNTYENHEISEYKFSDHWVKDLVELSVDEKAPLLVKEFLAKKGIILVTEEHLPGTYLDGAAMLLETGNPIIALTLRFDRLDNFWFVLMHELGHVLLHLYDSLNMDFFDEEGNSDSDEIEREADKFALDSLIPEESWDMCLSRFSMSEESIKLDAENIGVHPSIIAGRIRKERNNYTILSNMVGQGMVRKYIGEQG
jgi:HTH-type transcriptional regulator/antitoxin HigA